MLRVLTLMALLAIAAPLLAMADDPQVIIRPACDGAGFQGTSTDEQSGVSIGFEACDLQPGCRARVWTGGGDPIIEVRIADDGESATVIAGIRIVEGLTTEQLDRMESALTSPEAALVRPLWHQLLDMGVDADADRMLCMAGVGQALEVADAGAASLEQATPTR